jgi:hypothetical protein
MRRTWLAITCTTLLLAAAPWAQEGTTSVAGESRVFEMRTYHAAPGKLEALHARFRHHTSALFEKHGMTIVGYWVPIDESGAPSGNTLVYILAYPDRAARDAAWKAFGADPAWTSAKAESERAGKLVDKVESVFLKATDYSPIK